MKRPPTMEQRIADRLHQLRLHVLGYVVETDRVQVYRCSRPGEGRIMSFQVAFTPEGIAIQGDFTPEQNGCVSSYGKGRGWFAGQLSPRYLAEKFLQKGHHAEQVVCWLLDHADDLEQQLLDEDLPTRLDEEDQARLRERIAKIRELAQGDEVLESPERFRDAFEAIVPDWDWDDGPWDYQPQALADLAAIQQTFARLWAEHVKGATDGPQS